MGVGGERCNGGVQRKNRVTNLLDGLLGCIDDAALRAALTDEVARLRETKTFGLMFERHLPENARLRSFPIKRGVKVQERAGTMDTTWLVQRVKNGTAHLVDDSGSEQTRPLQELVVVREFGEPIYPGLKPVATVNCGTDKLPHVVINGENYHALEALLYAVRGQVDVLYLDPPYNSGARDWTYNNDYVDGSDTYRHSKWLSFMEKRLTLSRLLLKKDAVMVVTIDEHEIARLGVLLSQLFPDADMTLVTIVTNPKGVTRPGVRRFSRVEEYAYFCFFGQAGLGAWGDDLLTLGANELEKVAATKGLKKRPRWKGLLRSGTNARRTDRKHLFYPVLIDKKRGAVVGTGDPLPFEQAPNFKKGISGFHPVWPVRKDLSLGNWGVGHLTLREMIEKGYVALGGYDEKRNTWGLRYLSKEPQEQIAAGILVVDDFDTTRNVVDVVYADADSTARRIKTVWHRTAHDAGAGGTDVVSSLLNGRYFTFPKSVYAVRDTLAMLTQHKKDALIVDYFGGSGTTAHATMMLNSEDGGSRRCRLITNNELEAEDQVALRQQGFYPGDTEWDSKGIFNRAAKPRLQAAATGKRADGTTVPSKLKNANGTPMSEGLAENIEFFELQYLDSNVISRGRAFAAIAPLLWLRAGAVGPMIIKEKKPFAMPDGGRYTVLFNLHEWRVFAEALGNRTEITHAFVVTDSLAQYQQVTAELPQTVEVAMLYEDYLRNFEINLAGAK